MFRGRQRVIFLFAFALVALVACVTLIYSVKRRTRAVAPQPQAAQTIAPQPGATAQTITTGNGEGTTATYQVQESAGPTPDAVCKRPAPEIVSYTVSPAAVSWGEQAELSWYVTGAEVIKVAGHTFREERGSLKIDPRQWRRLGTKLTDPIPFPLVAYAQENCAPVERQVAVAFKEAAGDEK